MSQPSDPSVSLVSITKAANGAIPDSYFVILKPDCSKEAHITWMKEEVEKYSRTSHKCEIAHEYDIVKGYAVKLSGDALEALRSRNDVELIVEDTETYPAGYGEEVGTPFNLDDSKDTPLHDNEQSPEVADGARTLRTNGTWGLARISQRGPLPGTANPANLNFLYTLPNFVNPHRVDAYVIDTGVFTGHTEFFGRARWGVTFAGANADVSGHGTHVAGILAGTRFGVAKSANIIAVKVFPDQGPGTATDIVAGIDWVARSAAASGIPSVVNMSLENPANLVVDLAANNAVARGLHVCAAAGNSNTTANNVSPARAANVITVGAMNIRDRRWAGSNTGPPVRIFAPGEQVASAWIGGPQATNFLSGTSMATPHVAGLIAFIISRDGNVRTPAAMRAEIERLGVRGILADIPQDTQNLMLWTGYNA